MPEEPKCPVCGAELPGDSLGVQCVHCLLRLGLGQGAGKLGEPSRPPETTADGGAEAASTAREPAPADAAVTLTERSGTLVRYFGDFELLEEIARGGMGVVYKARQLSLNRLVALKMILSGQLADEAEVRRFHTEAEAAANLAHPNIVPIHEIGEHRGRHYFSMELVEGGNLAGKLGDRKWKLEERVRLLATVAGAVHHAHQRGIIHRDLKPSNILIDPQGQPRVTDFGLARRMEGDGNLTQSGVAMGTPNYMAPEQVLGQSKQMTTGVDVWALGVILYQLLTDQLPFKTQTREATWRLILEGEPQRPGLVNPKVDRDLETICLKCLQKSPDKRYGSAEVLAEDLGRWLRNEPITARGISLWESAAKWMRRRPALAGLWFVIGVSALSFVGLIIQNRARLQLERDAYLVQRDAAVSAKADADRQRATATAAQATATTERDAALRAKAEAVHHQQLAESANAESDRLLSKLTLVKAEELLVEDEASLGLAYLALALRKEPTNAFLAERLVSALSSRTFPLPNFVNELRRDQYMTVIFSPNGRKVASSSLLGDLSLWEPNTGKSLARIKTDGRVLGTGIAFSQDGTKLVAASRPEGSSSRWIVQVWSPETGDSLAGPFPAAGEVRSAGFSPDGHRLVTVTDAITLKGLESSVQLWDTTSPKTNQSLMRQWDGPDFAHFSPDGHSLVTTYGTTAHLWDAENPAQRRPIREFPLAPNVTANIRSMSAVRDLLDQLALVNPVVFTSDGQRLITPQGKQAYIWNLVSTQGMARPMSHETKIESTIASPDSDRVVTVCPEGAFVWNARTGQRLLGPLNAEALSAGGEFSGDGLRLCIWSSEMGFRVWDVHSGRPLTERLAGTFRGQSFSPNGDQVAVIHANGAAWVWDVGFGQASPLLLPHRSLVSSAHFDHTGGRVVTASADNTARIWSATTGQSQGPPLPHEDRVTWADFSRDGRQVFTACRDSRLRIWDIETGRQIQAFEADDSVHMARLSADGTRLLAIEDDELRLWDAQTAKAITTGKRDNRDATFADFSRDGRLLVSCDMDKATIVESRTGKKLSSLKHGSEVSFAQFSPDGERIVTGTARGTAHLWDVRRSKTPLLSMTHRGPVRSVAFSPDGQRILTASWDKTARLWDAQTGEAILEPMKHAGPVQYAAFSPRGTRIVTVSGRHVRVWSSATSQPVSEPLEHDREVKTAEFSADSQRLVTSCGGDSALVWMMPEIHEAVPGWLSELGEVVAGQRINPDGTAAPVPFRDLIAMRTARVANTNTGAYEDFGRWFFANRSTRTISPFSTVTASHEVERLTLENTFESLEHAVRLAPTNALALARLARRVIAQEATDSSLNRGKADALVRRALELATQDEEIKNIATAVRKAAAALSE